MRWDNLRDDHHDPAAGTLPVAVPGAVVRTFDTPEFRGITFYEVHARSVINRVPAASRMPFTWTVNPYRGCSHACVYCLAGDTGILMADGTSRPLAEVRVDDLIIGTVHDGMSRRYAFTRVLAHWSTQKDAYRITLDDGTRLVASADHRFLGDQGWAQVGPPAPGRRARPLGVHTRLVGPGGGPVDAGKPVSETRAVARVEALGARQPMFDITTGTGDFIANGVVAHNCFARRTHEYLDLDAGRDFDSRIVVKVNTPELVRRELAAPRWRGEHIAMGTNVDCYQRAEGRYRLMPGVLAALRDFANPFSILTKGSLILRDLPLLVQAAQVTDVSTAVSVGFLDRDLWRLVEPGTPNPRTRLAVCETLNGAGVRCGVLMAPILPFLTDSPDQLDQTVAAIARSGATHVTPIVLHLRPGAREWFFAWLARHHPDLVPRYHRLYRGGSYAPKQYQSEITERVRALARRHGVGAGQPENSRRIARPAPPPEPAEQLSLL